MSKRRLFVGCRLQCPLVVSASPDATRLLALYRRTSENTMYIFDDKLKRLKAMLPLAELMALETRLPRLRAIRQQERVEAMNEAGEGHGPRAKRRRTQRVSRHAGCGSPSDLVAGLTLPPPRFLNFLPSCPSYNPHLAHQLLGRRA